MEEYPVRILNIEQLTHNVKRFQVEKPSDYTFIPGQATEVSINNPEFKEEKRPFTFTSLTEEPYLEFTIKIYSDHDGVTNELGKLKVGDELIIRDVWGAIQYKGKGTFIAGGAGVTPFIAIIRDLYKKQELIGNQLIFANRTNADIIMQEEFNLMLGNDFINILSDENIECRYHGMVDDEFLKMHCEGFDKNFYVCGPPPMIDSVLKHLDNLGYSKDLITIEI